MHGRQTPEVLVPLVDADVRPMLHPMNQSASRRPMIRPSVSPRHFILASLSAHALFLLLRFTYFWLGDLVEDHHGTFLRRFITEGTGALGGALLS